MRRSTFVSIIAALIMATAVSASPVAGASGAPVHLPGLSDSVRIARDVRGIAHITARNEHDLYFVQGWVEAEDRLFQMDVNRRTPSGTLAELLGSDALASDVQLRTLGLRRAAVRSLPVLSAGAQAALQAFSDGVNAWATSHPLPVEYGVLHLTSFDPWTPLDSVTIGKAIAFQLSFDVDIDLTLQYAAYAQAGVLGGFDGNALFFQDAFRSAPFNAASTVPDATGSSSSAIAKVKLGGVSAKGLQLAKQYLRQIEKVPFLQTILDKNRRAGSNEWGIAAKSSATGFPMIANDPHLSLTTPSTFYPIHLEAGSMDVYGETFAGAPGVILGHNQFIEWGATTNPMDVTDTYQEQVVPDATSPSGLSTVYKGDLEHVIAIPETYRTNTLGSGVVQVPPLPIIPPATLIVPRRNNGPIVSLDAGSGTALSIQYTGYSPTRELDAFYIFDHARNLSDFEKGLQYFDVGSQNFAYADTKGNLAYFTSAEMPLREDLEAGTVNGAPPFFIRNGTGGNEWLPATTTYPGQALPYQILPPAEMPHVVNPPSGFFVNANNDPAGTTLDNDPLNQLRPTGGIFYLSPGYDGFRAGRITEMIKQRLQSGKISFADMQAMQSDTTVLDAETFVPYILNAWDDAQASSTPALQTLASDTGVAEAIERLRAWNFTTPTGIPQGYDASDANGVLAAPTNAEIANSVAATIYALWRSRALANTIDATLGGLGLPLPDGSLALGDLRQLLDTFDTSHGVGASGIDFFTVSGVSDAADARDVLLLRSVRQALDALASPTFAAAFGGSNDQNDYRWGKLHRIVFSSTLDDVFSIPPAGGAFPAPLAGLSGIPADGGFDTVDAASHDARAHTLNAFMFGGGPVRRFVGEARPGGITAVSALPGGTSGTLGSPYYFNLLPAWLTNEAYPQFMKQSDLNATFVSEVKLVP
ncbi:MAG: penicillin acylase family protein [Actinomycetota bacterium]